MSSIDFDALAMEARLIGLERADHIDRMALDPKRFTPEEVSKRRWRLPALRDICRVLSAVAASPEAQALVLKHIAENREAA